MRDVGNLHLAQGAAPSVREGAGVRPLAGPSHVIKEPAVVERGSVVLHPPDGGERVAGEETGSLPCDRQKIKD